MASRGMGAIRKGVVKKRRDNTDFTEYAEGGVTKKADEPVQMYAKGGEVWNRPRPKNLPPPKALSPAKKAAAKAEAKAKGQAYPSLVANMRAARKK